MTEDQTPTAPDATVTVQQAMIDVMKAVGAVRKTGRNKHQNFNFRGIDAVVNAVSPALQRAGVVVVPELQKFDRQAMQTTKGNAMNSVDVIVKYTFIGPNGDTISATVPGEAFDSGDKATAKAMSVAFRTALLQALALPTDDHDPDTESYNATPVGYGRPAPNRPQGNYNQQAPQQHGYAQQQAPQQQYAQQPGYGQQQHGYAPQQPQQAPQQPAARRPDLQAQINAAEAAPTGPAAPVAENAEALNERLVQAWNAPDQLKALRIWAAKVPDLPEGYLAAIRDREHALYQAQQQQQ